MATKAGPCCSWQCIVKGEASAGCGGFRRSVSTALRGLDLPVLLLLAGSSRTHDPSKVAARAEALLPRVAAEAPERGPCRAVLAQQLQRGRHDRHLPVVDAEAAFGPLALPVLTGEFGDPLYLRPRGPLADLVEGEQDRRVSNLAAMIGASSAQLSASMNNSGSPASAAVRTMSAHSHPTPGFLQVPVAGRRPRWHRK
ncbi:MULTISPECIES: hypothetical protein [Streptomyces]